MSSLKIRSTFDSSAKIPNYLFLNDYLEAKTNLIETIPSILARFGLYQISIISDIRRAFLQISLNENERNFLQFLLYDKQDDVKTYIHRRVVFGPTSSLFLFLQHHLLEEN